jgi:hypothetical protein
MDFFLHYKIIIMRSLGAMMLIVGIAVNFWSMPQSGMSANDKAAARITRMNASTQSNKSSYTKLNQSQKDSSSFLDALKKTQAKQMKYITMIAMIMGVGFLGYSFFPKKEEDA